MIKNRSPFFWLAVIYLAGAIFIGVVAESTVGKGAGIVSGLLWPIALCMGMIGG